MNDVFIFLSGKPAAVRDLAYPVRFHLEDVQEGGGQLLDSRGGGSFQGNRHCHQWVCLVGHKNERIRILIQGAEPCESGSWSDFAVTKSWILHANTFILCRKYRYRYGGSGILTFCYQFRFDSPLNPLVPGAYVYLVPSLDLYRRIKRLGHELFKQVL